MSQVKTEPKAPQQAAAPAAKEQGLRIVLFGLPDSGKSTLLGALVQAAQTQAETLQGRFTDVTGNLIKLHKEAYSKDPPPTKAEVISYPVTFQAGKKDAPGPTEDIAFIDCDGRAANTLISVQELLGEGPRQELANAILNAHSLILTLDSSSTETELRNTFTAFGNFLHSLEKSRGQRNEVNGLPVYLVLTKCDTLANQEDSLSDWYHRIDDRKEKVAERFKQYFLAQSQSGQPFGKIDLHLHATARHRPSFGGQPAKTPQPYQVAELFRQVIQSARTFRDHHKKAMRQLGFTLGAVGLVAGLMLVLAVFFLWYRVDAQVRQLQKDIEVYYVSNPPDDVTRLENNDANINRLLQFKENSQFAELPSGYQEKINNELKELRAYRGFGKQLTELTRQVGTPREIGQKKELIKFLEKLEELKFPPEYASAWTQAKKIQEQQQYRIDAKESLRALDIAEKKFHDLVDDAKQAIGLRNMGMLTEAYKAAKGAMQKFYVFDKWHQTQQDKPVADTTTITWAHIFYYDRITELQDEWNNRKQTLIMILNAGGGVP